MRHARLLFAGSAGLIASAAGYLLLRDQTTDNDDTGEDVGRIEVQRGASSLGLRAAEVLSRHVGERGQGKKKTPGYHRSPFIDRVNAGLYNDAPGLLGAPWCCRAVRWAYEVAAQELGRPRPFPKAWGDLASVSKFKKHLGGYKISAPKVGALLLIGDTHATLIAKVYDSRTVGTIEGNHSDSVANVKRTIGPADTLIDIEAAVAGQTAVGLDGLDLMGADFALAC